MIPSSSSATGDSAAADARTISSTGVGGEWHPTIAHARATAAALALATLAVVFRRPDLLVLAVPFGVASVAASFGRPHEPPTWDERLGHKVVREGDATRWRATFGVDPGCVIIAVAMPPERWMQRRPVGGAALVRPSDGTAEVDIVVRPTRWGHRSVGPVVVTAADGWAAYRSSGETRIRRLTALPVAGPFDRTAPVRPSVGLVGQYRSIRRGEGGEFAAIRPFQPGDRLRRINWPRSLRGRDLQVNATWADQDTHVALVLDATDDFGVPGVDDRDGPPSSLDVAVRAAAAIAEHAARSGDRVSLFVFGTTVPRAVPPASGRAHTRRILGVLADVRPGGRNTASRMPAILPGVTGSSLVVLLSPLVTSEALDRAATLGRRGWSVVVIDTLPDHVVGDDPNTSLAWRIRRLQRRREIRRIEQVGVPVVRWYGPGSLDVFLRDLARRSRAPKVVR